MSVPRLAAAVVTIVLTAVGSPAAATEARPGAWMSPVPDAPLLRAFDAPEHRWSPGHRGVDLAALPGASVVAPSDGVVTLARRIAGVPVVVVAHGAVRSDDELRSTFEAATTDLPVGALVRRGEPFAVVEDWAGHCSTAPCLHWGVRRGHDYVDPSSLLRGPVRLLPVGPPVRRDDTSAAASAAHVAPRPPAPTAPAARDGAAASPPDPAGAPTGTTTVLTIGAAVAVGAGTHGLRRRRAGSGSA